MCISVHNKVELMENSASIKTQTLICHVFLGGKSRGAAATSSNYSERGRCSGYRTLAHAAVCICWHEKLKVGTDVPWLPEKFLKNSFRIFVRINCSGIFSFRETSQPRKKIHAVIFGWLSDAFFFRGCRFGDAVVAFLSDATAGPTASQIL